MDLPLFVAASRGVLLIAFERHSKPVVCKFTAVAEDVVREAEVLFDLWREPALEGVVGPVELVKVKSHQHVGAMGGQSTAHLERICTYR